MAVGKMHAEALERRVLLSVVFDSTTGVLTVNGTANADKVVFTKSGSSLKVLEAGSNYNFTYSSVKSIDVSLGAGADSVDLGSSIAIPSSLTAGSGPDTLTGGGAACTMVAGSGNDSLVGTGPDTTYVFVPQSNATVYTLNQAVGGVNELDFSALPASDPVTVNLQHDILATYMHVEVKDASGGQYSNFDWISGGQGNDNLTGNGKPNTIVAGNGDDYIYGGSGPAFIQLGNGFDVVQCDGGADTVLGGSGHDVIYATTWMSDPEWFPAVLTAAPPKVTPPGIAVYAGSGDTSIVGGAGNDTLVGGGGNCTIHGLGGDDYISGGLGRSVLFGDSGNDTMVGGQGDNIISPGTGIDAIHGGTVGGTSTFIDADLPDKLPYDGQGAVIDTAALTLAAIDNDQTQPATPPANGTPGVGDLVLGGSANTTIIGGNGDDTLRGGDGPATLVSGSGDSLLIAGKGDDVLQGGTGEDTLAAGAGPDLMTGGSGNVIFLNLNGFADTLIGGGGFSEAQDDPTGQSTFTNIEFIYTPQPFNDDIAIAPPKAVPALNPPVVPPMASVVGGVLKMGSTTYASPQYIEVDQSGSTLTVSQANVGVQVFSTTGIRSVSIVTGAGDDSINILSLALPATVNAGNGNNTVYGGLSANTITTGSGNDTIFGGSANDSISGGNGNNLIYSGTGNSVINGGNGSDWIFPGASAGYIFNDHISDTINGGSGTEKLDLAYDADPMTIRLDKGTITDNTTGAVTRIKNVRNLWAGLGNDLIVGGTAGGVLLNAGSGNDSLFGISASDVVCGGAGDDQVFLDGNQGFVDLAGSHTSTPGNTDLYNQGTTIIPPSVDSTDIKVALQHAPP